MHRKERSSVLQTVNVYPVIAVIMLLLLGASPSGADTDGIFSGDPEVTFNGVMNITDSNQTRGICYFGTGAVRNYGNIGTATTGGNGISIGIYSVSSNGLIENGGTITSTAHAENASAYAIFSPTSNTVTSNGNITATAIAASSSYASGIYTANSVVTNNGNISVETGSIQGLGHVTSNASGIVVTGSTAGAKNTGSITVCAREAKIATAIGIYSAGAAVNNSGNITVSATGAISQAYGIYYSSDGTLTNTGVIQASNGIYYDSGTANGAGAFPAGDNNAFEVYIESGTVNLANIYKMTLDGDSARGSIFLNTGSVLNLNASAFSVSASPDMRFNTEYRIFGGTGTVNGIFGNVVPAQNSAVSVIYHDQGTAESNDDTVSLSYHPGTSPAAEGVNIGRYLLNAALEPVRQQQLNGFLSGLLPGRPVTLAANNTVASDAPAGPVQPAMQNAAYIIPYYAYLDHSSGRLGYKVKMTGFTAGYEKRLDRAKLGLHLGYGRGDVNYNGSDFPEYTQDLQNMLFGGFQGVTRWGNWIMRGDLTGFYNHHNYEGVSGVSFEAREKERYNGWGTTENLMGGYAFKAGSHVFLPEIGFNHTWLQQEGYRTSASYGGWETENSPVSYSLFQALASVRWLGSFSLAPIPCTTSLALGGRYRINNDDLTVAQTVSGSAPVTVTADQTRTAATASFSLAFRKDNVAGELGYNGEYAEDTAMHTVWLKFAYAF